MNKIVEQDIEKESLQILEELGYELIQGIDIAPDPETKLRSKWNIQY